MYTVYKGIKIKGIAAAAPSQIIDNEKVAAESGSKRNIRQTQLTGIKTRHVCEEGQAASDLATVAADRLLTHLGWNRREISALVFVTQSEDLSTPSTAMIVQHRLGIGTDCLCFDVNLGCTGYVSGLQIISGILTNTHGKGLLLVGDGKYYADRVSDHNGLLFGDGAAATALEYDEHAADIICSQYTDGSRADKLFKPINGSVHMDGNAVLLFSLEDVSANIKEMRQKYEITEKDIDFYVFHQAQKMILEGMAQECSIPEEKILISFDFYGNTSTATIPLTICANKDRITAHKTARLFMSGFGIGLAYANVYLELDTENILSMECTQKKYGLKQFEL